MGGRGGRGATVEAAESGERGELGPPASGDATEEEARESGRLGRSSGVKGTIEDGGEPERTDRSPVSRRTKEGDRELVRTVTLNRYRRGGRKGGEDPEDAPHNTKIRRRETFVLVIAVAPWAISGECSGGGIATGFLTHRNILLPPRLPRLLASFLTFSNAFLRTDGQIKSPSHPTQKRQKQENQPSSRNSFTVQRTP